MVKKDECASTKMAENKLFDIICISDAPFNYPLWTNKQHIMSRLAERGYRVLYVDPQLGFSGWLKWFLQGRLHFSDLFLWVKRKGKNLWLFSPILMPPRYRWGRRVNDFVRREGARLLARSMGIKDPILWIYHPNGVSFLGRMNERMVVYDCVDEYSAFPAYSSPQRKNEIISNERKLLERADIVFTTSMPLQEAKKKFNPNTYFVHNVADVSHFSRAYYDELPLPEDLKGIRKPAVGFIGALDSYKVDFELVSRAASSHPEWSIVLIGPVAEGDRFTSIKDIEAKENVHFLGLKLYRELPSYLKFFDVCIIPYRINDYTLYSFPLKVYEFLAAGKPVVATDLPSLALTELRDVLRIASGPEEFIKQIAEALLENSSQAEKRVEVAQKNTWDHRIDRLLSIITDRLSDPERR